MSNDTKNFHTRRSLIRRASSLGLMLNLQAFVIGGVASGYSAMASSSEQLGLLVVMNQDIDMPSINDEELRLLFLGKSRRLPIGARAALAAYEPESSFFNSRVLGRSDAEVSAIWSRLRFSGRTPPPRILNTADELLRYVRATPNALAYSPASAGSTGVRVIANVPRSTPPLIGE